MTKLTRLWTCSRIRGPCRENTWNHGVVHAWKLRFPSPLEAYLGESQSNGDGRVEDLNGWEDPQPWKTITTFPLKIDFEYLWLDQIRYPQGPRIRHGLPNPSELPRSFWLCPLLVLVIYWRCPLVSAQMGYRWHQRSGGRGRNLSPSEQSRLSVNAPAFSVYKWYIRTNISPWAFPGSTI